MRSASVKSLAARAATRASSSASTSAPSAWVCAVGARGAPERVERVDAEHLGHRPHGARELGDELQVGRAVEFEVAEADALVQGGEGARDVEVVIHRLGERGGQVARRRLLQSAERALARVRNVSMRPNDASASASEPSVKSIVER